MGYYEFPHTRNYDTDLGYLIKRYFELNNDFESLEKNFNDLKAWCLSQLESEALKNLVANKLNEWLEDGTLASLINNPLLHITTYDTIVEMISHSGLEVGAKVYCAGADNINDGKGGHFRIRTRLSTDVIDNYNLYLIDGGIKVAERITDKKDKLKLIMIGDSYGEQNDGSISKWYWEYVRDSLELEENVTFFHGFQSGAGFGNNNYLAKLQTLETLINNKDSVTDILVCGGWNDSDLSQPYGSEEAFNNGVIAFKNYVKSTYPNARISIAHIAWGNPEIVPVLLNQMPISINRYHNLSSYGFRILTNTEWILHRYNNIWQADGAHPNQLGESYLGLYLPNAFINGSTDIVETYNNNLKQSSIYNIHNSTNDDITSYFNNGNVTISNNNPNCYLDLNGDNFNCNGSTVYKFCGANLVIAKGTNSSPITVPCLFYTGTKFVIGYLIISLENANFSFRIVILKDDRTGTYENLNLKFLFIPQFTLNIPALKC